MRISSVTRSEFELENGKIFPISPPFEYKSTVHYYPRFKASSCVCCECGMRHDLKLSDRWLLCPCGNEIDRDYNAAINIKLAGASRDVTPVET